MKYKMEQLINRSYKALLKLKKIDSQTNMADFILKMGEELKEIEKAYFKEGEERTKNEVRQLLTVCVMALQHLGYNPIEEFEKEVVYNEKRANEVPDKV